MAVEITRNDLSAGELRLAAARTKDANAARRMLALALVLEGVDRRAAAQRFQHRQAALFGHADIKQRQRVIMGGQRRFGLGTVAHPINGITGGFERIAHGLGNHGVVFKQ